MIERAVEGSHRGQCHPFKVPTPIPPRAAFDSLMLLAISVRFTAGPHHRKRVHVISPMHDLAVFDSNHSNEPVVVGGAVREYLAMYVVFDDHDTRVLRSVNDERVSTMENDVVAVAGIERHERITTTHYSGPARKVVSKLEHRVGGNAIKIVVAVHQSGQTLLYDLEERVEGREGRVLRVGHMLIPFVVREGLGGARCQFLSVDLAPFSSVQFVRAN